jgi:RimJ/RimL family protein N-acetyltransferase
VGEPNPLLLELPDELVGDRVVVRPYAETDAAELWASIDESREHIAAWLPWVDSYQRPEDAIAHIRRFRARWLLREDLVAGVFERDTPRLLGGSGLHRIDWSIRRFEIGYWLRESAVGRGYMTEAVQLLTRFAFDQLDANRVEIRMDTGNLRSRAIPERLEFVYEGCFRQGMRGMQGQPRDVDVFALIRDDYAGLDWRTPQSSSGPT